MLFFFLLQICSTIIVSCQQPDEQLPLKKIKLPPGFHISIFADNVPSARSMVLTPNQTLFVGTRVGSVYAVLDMNRDQRADKVLSIANGLNMPNGVEFRNIK